MTTGGWWRGLQWGRRAEGQPHGLAQSCCACQGSQWHSQVCGRVGVQDWGVPSGTAGGAGASCGGARPRVQGMYLPVLGQVSGTGVTGLMELGVLGALGAVDTR